MNQVFINKIQIMKKLHRQGNAKIKAALRDKVAPIYEQAREELFEEIDNHVVSRELNDGPNAANISNTLGGPANEKSGNLFSYLGFEEGRSPVAEIKESIYTRMRGPTFKKTGSAHNPNYLITIKRPTVEAIEGDDSMRVDGGYTGRSWVSMIEDGYDNATSYYFKRGKEFKQSKSGPAYQIKRQLNEKSFKAHPYLTKIIENFDRKIFKGIERASVRR